MHNSKIKSTCCYLFAEDSKDLYNLDPQDAYVLNGNWYITAKTNEFYDRGFNYIMQTDGYR